jgi:hypothetical protein
VCANILGVANPRLTVRNYFKMTKTLVACSDLLEINGTEHSGSDPSSNWTRFNLPLASLADANIVIREESCDL